MKKKKLYDIILYICNEIPKFDNGALKINKLIWFIESEYYRKHEKTITGVEFAALPHGPVMNGYTRIFNEMEKMGYFSIDKGDYRHIFSPKKNTSLDGLEASEKLVAQEVVAGLGELGEQALENLSHSDAYYITLHENSHSKGKLIDMDLVLLETSPLENPPMATSEDNQALKSLIGNLKLGA